MNDSTVAPTRTTSKTSKAPGRPVEVPDPTARQTIRTSAQIDFIDQAREQLAQVRGVLIMLLHTVDSREACMPALKVSPGFMGSIQFAQATMEKLDEISVEQSGSLDDVYWGIHFGSSILGMLENAEFNDGCEFSYEPRVYFGCFDAVLRCVDRARAGLDAREAA